jgi:prepilin signal peptidase PulO-like enzyme (type II secretory pathway)
MDYFFYSFLFIFGLAAGSFINVIGLRYKSGRKLLSEDIISGRSNCPKCEKKLSWYELIPFFSFIFLGGKCRGCKGKISLQYSLIELISGAVFTLVPFFLAGQPWPIIVAWLLIFSLFILLSIIDFRLSVIPDQINALLAVLGMALIGLNNHYGSFSAFSGSFLGHFAGIFGFRENIWVSHAFAVFIGFAVFWLIVFLSRGRAMGWGDVKLGGALGLIFGWPDILMVLMLAFIVGAVFSLVLMAGGEKKIKDMIPFGPFLIIGSALVFFSGYWIISGYFSLFGLV